MILHIDSDASYLCAPKARSRVAGYFQLNSAQRNNPFINAAILIECKTLRHVVASSAEAETAGVFHNAQRAVPIRYLLTQLGHPQPATPIKCDNETTRNFIHKNITQKRSKSWDMRYNYLKDQQELNNFDTYWAKSEDMESNYYTKHFTARYHKMKRADHVKDKLVNVVNHISANIRSRQPDLQGCVSPGHTSPGPSVASRSLGSFRR